MLNQLEHEINNDESINKFMPTCRICNKDFKFLNNTHLAQHGLTIQEYKTKYNVNSVCDAELAYSRVDYCRGKTYEERFGDKKANELKEIRRSDAINQMKNIEQREVRKLTATNWKDPEQRRKNLSKSCSMPGVTQKRRATMMQRYGANVSANISPRFSKAAYNFITEYIQKHNISETKCYFLKGGRTGTEYYQHIDGKFICYDLVVLDDEGNIDLIFEFNGPWHYREEDVRADPDSPATPFKKSKTKLESYKHDMFKINHAKSISKNVLVYWMDTKKTDIIQ